METTETDIRFARIYDELMAEGKHGHYESMFKAFHTITNPDSDKLDLEKTITLAAQDAWKQPGNTTMNDMVGWILKKVLPNVINGLNARIEALEVYSVSIQNELHELKELENGKDGGLQKPKGRPATKNGQGISLS